MKTSPRFCQALLVTAALLLLTPPRLHAQSADITTLPGYGLSMWELRDQIAVEKDHVVWAKLPAIDDFAPNINSRIESYTGTLEEYVKAAKTQFNGVFEGNWQVSNERQTDRDYSAEFTGKVKGRPLHFSMRYVRFHRQIISITATATQAQWPQIGYQLTKYVDAFHWE